MSKDCPECDGSGSTTHRDDAPADTAWQSPCPLCGVSSGAPRDAIEVEVASEWTPPRDADAPRRMSTCGEVGLA